MGVEWKWEDDLEREERGTLMVGKREGYTWMEGISQPSHAEAPSSVWERIERRDWRFSANCLSSSSFRFQANWYKRCRSLVRLLPWSVFKYTVSSDVKYVSGRTCWSNNVVREEYRFISFVIVGFSLSNIRFWMRLICLYTGSTLLYSTWSGGYWSFLDPFLETERFFCFLLDRDAFVRTIKRERIDGTTS